MIRLLSSTGNTGTRTAGFLVLEHELINVFTDTALPLMAVGACICVDFWLGKRESDVRFDSAKLKGDKLLMEKYKWRWSRAARRSINKSIDYLLWVAVGVFVGMAAIEPCGIDYRWGGTVAAMAAMVCEGISFVGHFLFLHVLSGNKGNGVLGFCRTLAIIFAKKKNRDLGEALEEAWKTDNINEKETKK